MSKHYRVFVACPGDVQAEREAMSEVVDEVNQTHGTLLDYRLELLRWETHAAPGGGRPQQVINDIIGSYDIFVGIMWRRFGTPTGVAGSGTEEEFRIAYKAWEQNQNMPLMFYFSQQTFMPRSTDEIEQIRKVIELREELNGKLLSWDYPGPSQFPNVIRKHLCLRLSELAKPKSQHAAKPDDEMVALFKEMWPRMDSDLKEALSVAYNENRMAGDGGIKTQDLFAAFIRLRPEALKPILNEIIAPALPEPTSGPVATQPYIVEERPWLSHCVASSIRRLSKRLPAGRALNAADVFADIAKNGTGHSVRRLREHNVGPEEIDRILKQNNIKVVGA